MLHRDSRYYSQSAFLIVNSNRSSWTKGVSVFLFFASMIGKKSMKFFYLYGCRIISVLMRFIAIKTILSEQRAPKNEQTVRTSGQ